jgi:cellulose synthase/poly-beta-1,6-N-acetylglucosamine synthase-like glycosyltransferase
VILGIVDADGCLERHSLKTVAPYFDDERVGSVQIGVKIANARDGLLERLQDVEFVGFSCLVQIARDHLGSVGMGGNGQFTRMEAAETIGQHPWKREALTEDLDLGLSLIEAGWTTRFCADAFVLQQGLGTWRPLLRQRVRWTQGHYQCWTHIPPLAKSRNVPLRARLDLIAYLLLVTTMVIVAASVVLGLLGSLGVVHVTNSFLSFLPNDSLAIRVTLLGLSLLPLIAFVSTYQRHSDHPFRWWELPAAAFAFTMYSYVWVLSTVWAWSRMSTGRWSWTKTPRVRTSEARATRTLVPESAS